MNRQCLDLLWRNAILIKTQIIWKFLVIIPFLTIFSKRERLSYYKQFVYSYTPENSFKPIDWRESQSKEYVRKMIIRTI